MRVGVVTTGAANLASVRAALLRAGAEPVLVESGSALQGIDRLVLPGVGAFGPAMAGLRERGLDAGLRAHIDAERPLLAICLGLQLLFEGSDESPGVRGLGVFPGRAQLFPTSVAVPQMGWNRVIAPGSAHMRDGWAYFANSFRVACGGPPPGAASASDRAGEASSTCAERTDSDACDSRKWTSAATSDHGGPFLAAVERGPLLACQFHPELSGAWGAALIARWLSC